MPSKKHPRSGGRPSQIAASQIRDRILDIAADLFLTDGYGATSIEAIARRAEISKRTFYARFADKAALFTAVVARLIGGMRPAEVAPLFEGADLAEILQRLARIILAAALSPGALALHRLLISETRRFPELAAILASEGSRQEAVDRIAKLLQHHAAAGSKTADPVFAAEQFLQMVVAVPQQRALGLGTPMTAAECDAWADRAVKLFLHGYIG